MKKLLSTVLICYLLHSCGVNRIDSKYYKFNEHIDFKIIGFTNSKTRIGGNQTTYLARKGLRYKQISVRFKNNSESKQEFDLGNLFLIDKYNRKHKVVTIVKSGKFQIGNSIFKREQKLKGGKESLYILETDPPFPKDEIVMKLAIDDSGEEVLSESARIISLVTEE
jgi:hypothetical protein